MIGQWRLWSVALVLVTASVACEGTECVPSPTDTCGLTDQMLTVNINTITATGTVTSSPVGINCTVQDGVIEPGGCSAEFRSDMTVGLTVDAHATAVFEGWSGDCSGTGLCSLDMSQDRTVIANLPRRAIIAVDGSNELSFVANAGTNPPPQDKTIRNRGDKTLEYDASFNQTWLSVSPLTSGSIPPGASLVVSVVVDSDELSPGSYEGRITLTDPEAGNSPRFLDVLLTVN